MSAPLVLRFEVPYSVGVRVFASLLLALRGNDIRMSIPAHAQGAVHPSSYEMRSGKFTGYFTPVHWSVFYQLSHAIGAGAACPVRCVALDFKYLEHR